MGVKCGSIRVPGLQLSWAGQICHFSSSLVFVSFLTIFVVTEVKFNCSVFLSGCLSFYPDGLWILAGTFKHISYYVPQLSFRSS